MLGLAQLIVPPAPADGVEQAKVGPDVCVSDTKVRSPGSVSVRVAVSAGSGPPFCIAIAYARSVSGTANSGASSVTPTSAATTGPTRVDWVAGVVLVEGVGQLGTSTGSLCPVGQEVAARRRGIDVDGDRERRG